jgi:SAM-dependent methyltransferase
MNQEIRHPNGSVCPSCGVVEMQVFYQQKNVPVHSVLLHPTREDAVNYPTGHISLGFCSACGFISNLAFEPEVQEYSGKYEATQGYSDTFNAFHKRLALDLIERYQLRDKSIIEIGCGQGEFLALLCELGNNRGFGFDPAYVPGRSNIKKSNNLSFIQDFYSEKYSNYQGDFTCCKMTLEHIWPTFEFIDMIKCSIGDSPQGIAFFQVPNARYVFGDVAFWDIYYEHCSYFSLGSISRLFERASFRVVDLWTDYEDQYLMIGARPSEQRVNNQLPQSKDLQVLTEEVARFREIVPQRIAAWRERVKSLRSQGKKIVLWGGGSKAVAFLTTLGITLEQIEFVVDINPFKSGTFMAKTGQEITSPEKMREYQPDVVFVMNPIYCSEIQKALNTMGLVPKLLSVNCI